MTDTELNIVDFSRYKIVPIDSLIFADWNYKENDPELTVKLVANIRKNGQIENLLVRTLATGATEVVNGNHRLEALRMIGCKNVVVYDLGCISEQEAYRIAIETNETKFVADQIKLAKLVAEMSVGFSLEDLASTLPYTTSELSEYIKLNAFDFNDYDKRVKEAEDIPPTEPDNVLHITLTEELAAQWADWLLAITKEGKTFTTVEAFAGLLEVGLEHAELNGGL